MNYKLAYKAEKIARKMKERTQSDMPVMMFHPDAYIAIMTERESDWLTEQEIKECNEISDEQANKIVDML